MLSYINTFLGLSLKLYKFEGYSGTQPFFHNFVIQTEESGMTVQNKVENILRLGGWVGGWVGGGLLVRQEWVGIRSTSKSWWCRGEVKVTGSVGRSVPPFLCFFPSFLPAPPSLPVSDSTINISN